MLSAWHRYIPSLSQHGEGGGVRLPTPVSLLLCTQPALVVRCARTCVAGLVGADVDGWLAVLPAEGDDDADALVMQAEEER